MHVDIHLDYCAFQPCPLSNLISIIFLRDIHRQIRLAKSMEACPHPDVNAIKDCSDLWRDVDRMISAIRDESHKVTSSHLKMVTGAMVGLILAQSAQRPSAVMGATLGEYERATFVDGVWVINVHEHKTGQQGPARLTMDDDDKRRLDDYVLYVRPGLDPLYEHNKISRYQGDAHSKTPESYWQRSRRTTTYPCQLVLS